ncbi:MAG: hypothetical protein RPS47_15635 [Colwellia sp.]|jgi:hypothetical protein
MLYEFALEPKLVYRVTESRRNFVDFLQRFSIGNPAVISDYPKIKYFRKQVLSELDDALPESQKTMIEEVLKFLSESPRVKRCSGYNKNEDWVSNVTTENSRIPFDNIVCSTSGINIGEITLDDIHEGYPDYPRQVVVQRVADKITNTIENMLRLSTKIIFVDPYFSADDKNWVPFINFIEVAKEAQPVESLDVEVLFRKGARGIANDLAEKFQKSHRDLLIDCNITFKQIKERKNQEVIHNRYVLTDIGGVCFGIGLGEDAITASDEVTILDKVVYELRWSQYADMKGFDHCEIASC